MSYADYLQHEDRSIMDRLEIEQLDPHYVTIMNAEITHVVKYRVRGR